jgi:enediyne biosynthesis protein E4
MFSRDRVCRLVLAVSVAGVAGVMLAQNPLESHTQKAEEGAQSPPKGGSNTGGVFAPVYDSAKRPITVGGTVASGPVIFDDVAVKAGLAGWKHQMGTAEKKYILEVNGSGVALLDYDNDGWLDIYLVNGSTLPALEGKAAAPKAALFHNNHDEHLPT